MQFLPPCAPLILSENWKLCCLNRLLQHSHPLPRYQKSGRLVERASEVWSLEPFNYGTRLITGQSQTHAQPTLSVRLLSAFVILPPRFLLPLHTHEQHSSFAPKSLMNFSTRAHGDKVLTTTYLLQNALKARSYYKRGLSERICELPELEETL